MTTKLRNFKDRLHKSLVAGLSINENDDGRNQISKISFGKGQDDFIIIRQENKDKPKHSLFKNDDNKDEFKTTSSCDFIIIQDKTDLKIAFAECKSNKSDYETAFCQIKFSRLWLNYLIECYCECFKIDVEEKRKWQKAIQEAKKYLIYPQTNATATKSPTNKSPNSLKTKCEQLGMTPKPFLIQNTTLNIPNPADTFFG